MFRQNVYFIRTKNNFSQFLAMSRFFVSRNSLYCLSTCGSYLLLWLWLSLLLNNWILNSFSLLGLLSRLFCELLSLLVDSNSFCLDWLTCYIVNDLCGLFLNWLYLLNFLCLLHWLGLSWLINLLLRLLLLNLLLLLLLLLLLNLLLRLLLINLLRLLLLLLLDLLLGLLLLL